MLDGVDTGVEKVGQGLFAEDVDGHPGACGVGPPDGFPQRVGGPERGHVANASVDPVADELDPGVGLTARSGPAQIGGPTSARLSEHDLGEFGRLDLERRVG
jgi:hypothetical protein